MVDMEQKLDQCIFMKLSHRDYSGGILASWIAEGNVKAEGGWWKAGGFDTPLESMIF